MGTPLRRLSACLQPQRPGIPSLSVSHGLCVVLGLIFIGLVSAEGAPTPTKVYQSARTAYQLGDYERALALLKVVGEEGIHGKVGADIANLRGAINLKLHRYERAEADFKTAGKLDGGLWEANFNAAEVSFRCQAYRESARRFTALYADASAQRTSAQAELVRYKMLLSLVLAGEPAAALDYVKVHAHDPLPPLGYFYLKAALDDRRGRFAEGLHWQADSQTVYSTTAINLYASSFETLGWATPRRELGLVKLGDQFAAVRGLHANGSGEISSRPATVAVVELMGRMSPTAPPHPVSAPNGPSQAEDRADLESSPPTDIAEVVGPPANEPRRPLLLAKPASSNKKNHSPTPSASPSPSVDDGAASPAPTTDGTALGGDLPSASAAPAPSPEPAFIQAYEAAYVQFLKENYDGARELLDKADSIQPGQPSAVSLRGQIFKHFYSEAYMQYASKEYAGAVKELDEADKILPDQADSYNMRGLIFSRQKDYQNAEAMFKRAIALDSTFWEARFNQAELPFIRSNYTDARARFEALLGQTDPVKQPKETELTEFKVFLTLLLEGKEPAARSLMERFNFSGSTPARYYCQAALDFYHGDQDKALGWVSSARKEYSPKLEGIFAQAFYRVGWFSEANAAAIASATPAVGASPAGMGAPTAASTPMLVAAASPAASVPPAAGAASSSPIKPLPSASPVPAASSATGISTDALALATPPPLPSARPSPNATSPSANAPSTTVLPALSSPTTTQLALNSPVPQIALPTPRNRGSTPLPTPDQVASQTPTPRLSIIAPSAPPPTPSIAPPTSTVVATASPAASSATESRTVGPAASSSSPQPTPTTDNQGFAVTDAIALGAVAVAIGMTIINGLLGFLVIKKKKQRLAKKPLRYSGNTIAKPGEAKIS